MGVSCYDDRMPLYFVWDDECETIDDAVDIIADSEADAAEAWAEQAKAPFGDGRRIVVEDEDGVVTKWQYDPTYHANQVPPSD